MSLLDMAGTRVKNPGNKISGIFVNPIDPSGLMGQSFGEAESKKKKFKSAKELAKAARSIFNKHVNRLEKSGDLKRRELAAFKRMGKDSSAFEDGAGIFFAPRSRPLKKPRPKKETQMSRRANPHSSPKMALGQRFRTLRKDRKSYAFDSFVEDATVAFKDYINKNKAALTEAGVLADYQKLSRSKSQIRDAALGYASRQKDFTLTGTPEAKKKEKSEAAAKKKAKAKTATAKKKEKAKKEKAQKKAKAKKVARRPKGTILKGSGKGGRVLQKDVVNAVINGDASMAMVKQLCGYDKDVKRIVENGDFPTKVNIEKYRQGRMTKERAIKLGIANKNGELKVDAKRAAALVKARAARAASSETGEKEAKKTTSKKKSESKAPSKAKEKTTSTTTSRKKKKPAQGDVAKKKTLAFKDGSSDKVYELTLVKMPSGKYHVNAAHGRRGGTISEQRRTGNQVPKEEAMELFNKIVQEKEKKGYKSSSMDIYKGAGEKAKKTTSKKSESKTPSKAKEKTTSNVTEVARKYRENRDSRLKSHYGRVPTQKELGEMLEAKGIPSVKVPNKVVAEYKSQRNDKLLVLLMTPDAMTREESVQLANFMVKYGKAPISRIEFKRLGERLKSKSDFLSNPGTRQSNPATSLFEPLLENVRDGDYVGLLGQATSLGLGFAANALLTSLAGRYLPDFGATSASARASIKGVYSFATLLLSAVVGTKARDMGDVFEKYTGSFLLGGSLVTARNFLRAVPSDLGGVPEIRKAMALDGYCGCGEVVDGYEMFQPTVGGYTYDQMLDGAAEMGGMLPGQFAPASVTESWSPDVGQMDGFESWNPELGRFERWNPELGRYEVWNDAMGNFDPAIEAQALHGFDPAIEVQNLGNYLPATEIDPQIPTFTGQNSYYPTQDILYPTGYTPSPY